MVARATLGEFEQRVLLAILRCDHRPTALDVRRELERVLGREVSRGAFYTTLERLEAKGLLTWTLDRNSSTRRDAAPASSPRGGAPERRLSVTAQGKRDLR